MTIIRNYDYKPLIMLPINAICPKFINKVKNCTVMINAETDYTEIPFMSGDYIQQNFP